MFSHYYLVIYFFISQDSTFKSQTIHSLPVFIFILLPKFVSLFFFYLLFIFRAMQTARARGRFAQNWGRFEQTTRGSGKKNRCDCSIVFLISLISFSMYESIGMVCGSVSKINYDYVTALGSEGSPGSICWHQLLRSAYWCSLVNEAWFCRWSSVTAYPPLGRTPNPNSTKDFRNNEIYKKWSRVESDNEF